MLPIKLKQKTLLEVIHSFEVYLYLKVNTSLHFYADLGIRAKYIRL